MIGRRRKLSGITVHTVAAVFVFGCMCIPQAVAVHAQTTPAAQNPAGEAAGQAPPAPALNKLSEMTVDSVYAFTALALPMRGSYDQHTQAIMQLVGYAAPKGLMRDGPFGVYYNDPASVPVDSLRWEICVPVPEGTQAEAPFVVRRMPDMLAAQAICTGPYETVDACYGPFMAWIAQKGYAIAGPLEEHWLSEPATMPPEKLEARILVSVEPRAAE